MSREQYNDNNIADEIAMSAYPQISCLNADVPIPIVEFTKTDMSKNGNRKSCCWTATSLPVVSAMTMITIMIRIDILYAVSPMVLLIPSFPTVAKNDGKLIDTSDDVITLPHYTTKTQD